MHSFIILIKIIFLAPALSTLCHAKSLQLWISSFQDQVYYEKMADLFAKKNKGFELKVKAYGFREMPDKLGVALRTDEGIPDVVNWMRLSLGFF